MKTGKREWIAAGACFAAMVTVGVIYWPDPGWRPQVAGFITIMIVGFWPKKRQNRS